MWSEWFTACGVPHESVLGPTIYSDHTANFLVYVSCDRHFHADDAQIYYSCYPEDLNFLVSELNTNLRQINVRSMANGLKLNATRTQVLRSGTRNGLKRFHLIVLNRIVVESFR